MNSLSNFAENYLDAIFIFSTAIDVGLLVLILMVQLIIYPSFLYFTKINLTKWHLLYTQRIAIVVIPLMLSQLVLAFYFVISNFDMFSTIRFAVVVFLWIFTFTHFVPIHNKISNGDFIETDLKLLVKRNWVRTFLWTVLVFLNF